MDQECIMNDFDCEAVAMAVNIKLLSIVNIFYDDKFHFTTKKDNDNNDDDFLYDKNYKAAETIKRTLY